MFITFIYKIGKRNYYGKYVSDYISDDHEGLDDQVRPLVLDGINRFRNQHGLPPIHDVKIGILSLSLDEYVPCYSSEKEIECFDFYYETENYETKLYVNGKII